MNFQEKILVFKLGEDNDFSDLKINSEIKHFIADFRGITPRLAENIKNKFIIFANTISKMNGSFVIVCEFSFDEELTIVPSMQEAYDYIELDEMERQLEL